MHGTTHSLRRAITAGKGGVLFTAGLGGIMAMANVYKYKLELCSFKIKILIFIGISFKKYHRFLANAENILPRVVFATSPSSVNHGI